MASVSRRSLLASGGVAALGLTVAGVRGATADGAQHDHGAHGAARGGSGMAHADGVNGPMFRSGQTVDHAANGFDPHELLRDFDWGTTRRLAAGRVLREWDADAIDKEIEVTPGVKFAAWTYNGRIPGPTLRCPRGRAAADHVRQRLRSTRTRSTSTASTRPRWTACRASAPGRSQPGGSTVYEFDALPAGLHLYHCHVAAARRAHRQGPVRRVHRRPDATAARTPTRW